MTRQVRIGSGLGALAVASACLAQPAPFGIQIPMGGGPMPNYWSGTNCRASGGANIGEAITQAELLLNGQQVAFWQSPPGEPLPLSMGLKVMFDSSHFANGTAVTVTYRVWGQNTGLHQATSSTSPVVKNKLMIFEHPDPKFTPDPSSIVNSLMSGRNYLLEVEPGDNEWPASDYWSQLDGSSAVHYAGHGYPQSHIAGDGGALTPNDYLYNRTSQVGTDALPPFNASGKPPVFFCYLVACNCGETNAFQTVLWPYNMGWGGITLEDQALMAFKPGVFCGEEYTLSQLVWEHLNVGETAVTALLAFNQWLLDHPNSLHVDLGNKTERGMVPGDLICYAGPDGGSMRLKTVYTGTNVLPDTETTPWYRSL